MNTHKTKVSSILSQIQFEKQNNQIQGKKPKRLGWSDTLVRSTWSASGEKTQSRK